jgi:hypothetical protein
MTTSTVNYIGNQILGVGTVIIGISLETVSVVVNICAIGAGGLLSLVSTGFMLWRWRRAWNIAHRHSKKKKL